VADKYRESLGRSGTSANTRLFHRYQRQERDKYFPAPPAPPSENLDRFQWWNPFDWAGMHEEDKYQQEEEKYKSDLGDLSERRKPVHGRVYIVPHEATMNREHGSSEYFVYLPPNTFGGKDKKKYPQGAYAPVWWNQTKRTAGKMKNWEDKLIPHTTDDEGVPNTVRVSGVKDFIEPIRDVIPTPSRNPTENIHQFRDLRYKTKDGKTDWDTQEIRKQPWKEWLHKPVNSGAFNQYMQRIRPMV
jgi:hypothetical protein